MAEICCETTSSAAAVSKISQRSARRRRMEIRRFRFVSDADPSEELKVKRQRVDSSASSARLVKEITSTDTDTSTGRAPPPAAPEGPVVSNRCPRYGTTLVCGRRRDMEDAVSVHPSFFRRSVPAGERFHFFGVFDGHGCSHVATSCKQRMHEMVSDDLGREIGAEIDWKAVMQRSFFRMDEAAVMSCHGPRSSSCRCELQMPKCDHVGSTAVVAVVAPDRIVVGNCGDSRAVLCRNGVAVPLSVDHKPDRPDELERIEAAGGRVIYWEGARVLGVLAMSRAIGDEYLKPFVTSEPEVTTTERTGEEECLILASDGLWDVVTNEMACDIGRRCLRGSVPAEGDDGDVAGEGNSDKACSDAAMLLTKVALARRSADNVSVVVVDLRRSNGSRNSH